MLEKNVKGVAMTEGDVENMYGTEYGEPKLLMAPMSKTTSAPENKN